MKVSNMYKSESSRTHLGQGHVLLDLIGGHLEQRRHARRGDALFLPPCLQLLPFLHGTREGREEEQRAGDSKNSGVEMAKTRAEEARSRSARTNTCERTHSHTRNAHTHEVKRTPFS